MSSNFEIPFSNSGISKNAHSFEQDSSQTIE